MNTRLAMTPGRNRSASFIAFFSGQLLQANTDPRGTDRVMLTRATPPDDQGDPLVACRDDPGGISRNLTYCFMRLTNLDASHQPRCVSPTSTMECLNGLDAMRLRYGDRSCRRCLRSKRSGTDKRPVGCNPTRLVCGRWTRMLGSMPDKAAHRCIGFS
jgi:hypothetical protein